ncbi:MAG: anthranilate phosphoribosyltransferase [Dehalococcoidia bacterium]|nr:anthranilate phosphoribosyltransferase [Chloroflexota bacterium]OUW96460.1 MAG: anthranilate phosphoribosyltransferase [Chloroflexi bacterium TMED230]RZP13360.1 MAG: anthranilate phosphoribosyltransferase [Chloroflexota bacterium]|tara:strand:- start:835 stop:1854 length:1020 start_codon:yes stop_codon:yes gene_type:complete
MNILEIIKRVSSKEDLNFKESAFCMNEIMSGKLLPSQFGAIMVSLAIKGETAEEIAGMASVMRDFSVKIKGKENAIDVCGTGGSGLKWFNISTASAILVASCGVPVAKHGNRAASGNSGSADVLEELGINILIQPDKVENCLNEINLTFIFAQSFHPSMKFAAPYRKEIGIRTIFNFLGPLTNPASVKKQIIGTPNKEFAKKIAEAGKKLGSERIITISGHSGADEIELDKNTTIFDSNENFSEKIIEPKKNFGNSKFLVVNTPKESAKKIIDCFNMKNEETDIEKKSILNSILVNSAMALHLVDAKKSYEDCFNEAKENIFNGNALNKLNQLREITNK